MLSLSECVKILGWTDVRATTKGASAFGCGGGRGGFLKGLCFALKCCILCASKNCCVYITFAFAGVEC